MLCITVAYEYVADSEECYSESTLSSTHEATQHTLSESAAEETSALEVEAVVSMADVQWRVEQLAKPTICDRAQTLVQQLTQRFARLQHLCGKMFVFFVKQVSKIMWQKAASSSSRLSQ